MGIRIGLVQENRAGKIIKAALAAALVTVTAIAGVSAASNRVFSSNVNGNKLQCFSGTGDNPAIYGGDCSFKGNTAAIDNTDQGAEGAYGGVFIQNSNLGGKLLSNVNKLAFTYDDSTASGGSPRISIPIDENNNGDYDGFAFVDSTGCNDGSAVKGMLDAVNDTTCTISYKNAQYDNWAAFVAAYPDYRIAKDAVTFVIADQPGTYNISNVQLGKGPAKPAANQ